MDEALFLAKISGRHLVTRVQLLHYVGISGKLWHIPNTLLPHMLIVVALEGYVAFGAGGRYGYESSPCG